MQHPASRQLFEYWNQVRNGRFAPNRFEIEPVKLTGILPDVFILECPDASTYRFRLAGTRLCTVLGHELRGQNLLDYWTGNDKEAVHSLLHNVTSDGAGAVIGFENTGARKEPVDFEMLVLPLVHAEEKVNRILGCAAALNAPYWAGTAELRDLLLTKFNLLWPDMRPVRAVPPEPPALLARTGMPAADDARRRFRVYEGGLSRGAD